jgi:hypothetical protein
MPLYEFETEAGERFDAFFPLGGAPSLGVWGVVEGRFAQRVIGPPQLARPKGQMHDGPIVSEAAPNLAAIEHQDERARRFGEPRLVRADHYDHLGRAVFESVDSMKEYAKRDGRFGVGNPREFCAEAARVPGERRKADMAAIAERERQMKSLEVL